MLIYSAISEDRNVIKKEAEKILIYKDLTIEIQRIWNVKTKMIPVMEGRLGLIQSHLENAWATYQENMKLRNYRKQPH